MTAQEFKDQNPHLSHLEGYELWEAMELALLNQTPFVKRPDDDEIAEVIKCGGYTFSFTKGFIRSVAPLFHQRKNPTTAISIFVPHGWPNEKP